MKTLHLLRHAKSAWDQPGLSDRERGLNKRGQRDAPRMGAALAARVPAIPVAVSPARRAQLTLAGVRSAWPELAALPHITEEALYTFNCDDLLTWIAGQGDEQQAVFLIGHNPALTDLINSLCGQYCLDNLPTAGYAQLSLEIDCWGEVQHGCGVLQESLFPKQLGDG